MFKHPVGGRTAPKQPVRIEKSSRTNWKTYTADEIRFWKNVAVSLAISLVSLVFALLLALLLR